MTNPTWSPRLSPTLVIKRIQGVTFYPISSLSQRQKDKQWKKGFVSACTRYDSKIHPIKHDPPLIESFLLSMSVPIYPIQTLLLCLCKRRDKKIIALRFTESTFRPRLNYAGPDKKKTRKKEKKSNGISLG